jgi:hypothetical protein
VLLYDTDGCKISQEPRWSRSATSRHSTKHHTHSTTGAPRAASRPVLWNWWACRSHPRRRIAPYHWQSALRPLEGAAGIDMSAYMRSQRRIFESARMVLYLIKEPLYSVARSCELGSRSSHGIDDPLPTPLVGGLGEARQLCDGGIHGSRYLRLLEYRYEIHKGGQRRPELSMRHTSVSFKPERCHGEQSLRDGRERRKQAEESAVLSLRSLLVGREAELTDSDR